MEVEIRSVLGTVYEAFFKLGFGACNKKEVYDFLLHNNPQTAKFIENNSDLKNVIEKYTVSNPMDNRVLRGDSRWIYDYVVNLGLTQGELFKKDYINKLYKGEIKPVKFELGEGSSLHGVWKNADLMFIVKDVLFVVEIKTDRMLDIINMLDKSTFLVNSNLDLNKPVIENLARIPIKFSGVPVKLSPDNMDLVSFAEAIIKKEKELKNSLTHTLETAATLQSLSYAVSYLSEFKNSQIKAVKLEVIHPFEKLFSPMLRIKDGTDIDGLWSKLSELYTHARDKKTNRLYKQVFIEKDKETLSILEERLEFVKQKIEELNQKRIKIEADSISVVREDVKKVVENFFDRKKQEKNLKVLGLFHSAGAGKTTSIRSLADRQQKIAVFYFATRKILVEREEQEYKNLNFHTFRPNKYKNEENKNNHTYYRILSSSSRQAEISKISEEGNIMAITNHIKNLLEQGSISNKLAFFTTMQSIVDVYRTNTFSKLIEPMDILIEKGFKVFVILDEIFAHDGGLYVIQKMFSSLHNKDIFMFVLDANLYSANLLQILLEDFRRTKFIHPSLYAVDFKQSHSFEYSYVSNAQKVKVDIECYAKHGFVSEIGYINIIPCFIDKREKLKDIVIKAGKGHDKSVLVFFQDKEEGAVLRSSLLADGYSAIAVNTTFKSSEEEINSGNYKFIVATSTASRGVSFKNVKDTVVVFSNNNIEETLVEVIQAISRGRGQKEIENMERNIYAVFVVDLEKFLESVKEDSILTQDNEGIENFDIYYEYLFYDSFLKLNQIVERTVRQFIKTPEEGQEVIVPVPVFSRATYKPSNLIDTLNLFNTVRDIVKDISSYKGMSSTSEEFRSEEFKMIGELSSAFTFDVRNISNQYIYSHPYVVPTNNNLTYAYSKVYLTVDNYKIRGFLKQVEELLKEVNLRESLLEEIKKQIKDIEMKYTMLHSLHNEEQFYVLIPVYTQVYTKYLRPGEELILNMSANVSGLSTLARSIRILTKGLRQDRYSYVYPCIILEGDDMSPFYIEGRTQKYSVDFILNLLGG